MGDGLLASGIYVLLVRDLERSRAFYRDVLGMEAQNEDDDSSAFTTDNGMLLLLDEPGARDLLGDDAIAPGAGAGASFVMVAMVEDVDATHEALRAKGVAFLRGPEDRAWGLRTAHFKDPDGYVWEINSPLDGG